jgi:hypothetical protein
VLPERERKKNSLQAVPARPDYRTSPITEAFPWVVTIGRAIERFGLHPFAPIFLVAFTSKLKGDANPNDVSRLRELDEAAFEAASDADEFIDYYAGTVNEDGEARSYCLWPTRGAAHIVSNDKSHVAAQFMVHNYETYDAGRFLLHRVAEGVWFQNLGTGEGSLSTTTKAACLIGGDFRTSTAAVDRDLCC